MVTPLSAAFINRVCEQEGQEAFAKRCGISRAIISLHVTGERAIRDNHASNYLSALGPHAGSEFLAAWLRDIMPADAHTDILEGNSAKLRESVTAWRPQLNAEMNSMLDWLANNLAHDPELAEIFTQVVRKLGYDGPDTPPRNFAPADPDQVVYGAGSGAAKNADPLSVAAEESADYAADKLGWAKKEKSAGHKSKRGKK